MCRIEPRLADVDSEETRNQVGCIRVKIEEMSSKKGVATMYMRGRKAKGSIKKDCVGSLGGACRCLPCQGHEQRQRHHLGHGTRGCVCISKLHFFCP